MGAGRIAKMERRQEKNSKRMREDGTKDRGRNDEEEKVGDNHRTIISWKRERESRAANTF